MSLSQLLYGQAATLSDGGRFEVNYVRGCATLTIDAEIRDNYGPDRTRQYSYYKVGERPQSIGQLEFNNPLPFDFNEPGEYYLMQIIQSLPQGEQLDSIRIEVKEPETPYFEASNCGDNSVLIKANRDSSQYDYYLANDDPALVLNAANGYERSLSFPASGSYSILLKGMYYGEGANDEGVNNNCSTSRQDILVTNTLEPAGIYGVRASIADKSITVQYTLQPDAYQILEVQNGSGALIDQTGPLEGNQITLALNPTENYYCFTIRTDNRCDGTSLASNTVCTAQLSGTTEENSNNITFITSNQTNPAANLLRDGNIIHSFGSSRQGSYKDEEIVCNTTYAYSLELTYPEASSITEGLELQNQFSGTPPAPQNLASSWEGPSTVVFEFLQDNPMPNARYRAYRAEGNPPGLINMADTNHVPVPAGAQNTCYRFSYIDACDNESVLSEPVCALYLRNVSSQPDGLILEWNEYRGYANGVQSYTLSKFDADGNFVRSYPMGLQTSIDLGEQAIEESGSRYVVTAYPIDAQLTESSSNLFEFRIIMEGYFPNAFTPNGDEQNDYFKVEGKFVAKGRLQIFNRWGEQIYETNDIQQGWDGTAKGRPAPQDTYIYRAFVETIDGAQQTHRGSVFLLRK